MMQGTIGGFEWYQKRPKEALQAHFGFMTAFDKELKESGKLVATVGLACQDGACGAERGTSDGWRVSGGEGVPGGYWIVDVESEEEACGLAARISGRRVRRGGSGVRRIGGLR
jgi:hypothetical protein